MVAGARPQFVKLAPVFKALNASGHFLIKIVHTGQHYDHLLSGIFPILTIISVLVLHRKLYR